MVEKEVLQNFIGIKFWDLKRQLGVDNDYSDYKQNNIRQTYLDECIELLPYLMTRSGTVDEAKRLTKYYFVLKVSEHRHDLDITKARIDLGIAELKEKYCNEI